MQQIPSNSTIIWIIVSILVGVAGLVAKEVIRTLRYRHHLKENNDAQKEIKEALDTINNSNDQKEIKAALQKIQDDSGTISKDLVKTGRDVLKIAGTLKGFDERCTAHLTTQDNINQKVNGSIKTLDGRVFDIARKRKS